MMNKLTVDTTLCQKCGACVQECPHHLIALDRVHVDHTHPSCERCLHCYTVCPAGAIRLPDDYTPLVAEDAWHSVRPEALESLLAYRRSTRRFRKMPVPLDLVTRVVTAGRYIPSGGNRHAYEFTVLTEPAVKQALLVEFSQYYGQIRKLLEHPFLLKIAGMFLSPYERAFLKDADYGQRMKELLDRFHAGDDPVFYDAPVVIVIHTQELIPTPQEDSLLAGFAMALTAQTMGLGTCFVSLAHKGFSASRWSKKMIGIASQEYIHAVLLLGYPDVIYQRPAPKPKKAIRWI